MALDTYAKLEQAVKDWMHRDSIRGVSQGASVIETLIELGEKKINRQVRHRHMETALLGTTASGLLALPTDYTELKHAYVDRSPVVWLRRANARYIYAHFPLRSADGIPTFIAREGSNFIFGQFPDSAYTIKGIYYKRFPALQTAVNSLFLDHPDLYLYAALTQARAYIEENEHIALWDEAYQRAMDDIDSENRAEAESGSVLQADPVEGVCDTIFSI